MTREKDSTDRYCVQPGFGVENVHSRKDDVMDAKAGAKDGRILPTRAPSPTFGMRRARFKKS